jgi:hypothetical protein
MDGARCRMVSLLQYDYFHQNFSTPPSSSRFCSTYLPPHFCSKTLG